MELNLAALFGINKCDGCSVGSGLESTRSWFAGVCEIGGKLGLGGFVDCWIVGKERLGRLGVAAWRCCGAWGRSRCNSRMRVGKVRTFAAVILGCRLALHIVCLFVTSLYILVSISILFNY